MTDQESTQNERVTEGWGIDNVIAVSFDDDRNAYNALTQLKELDAQQRVGVQEAVVAERTEDGHVVEKDRAGSTDLPSTAAGGLIGLLIGIIGGPVGMLIGGTGGLLVGSMFDLADSEETDSALGGISSAVRVGHTALLAVLTEQSPEVVDAAMSGLGGSVLRRSLADVKAEVAATEEAERKAKWQARKELVRGRHEHDKAAVNAKVEELKAKVQEAHLEEAAAQAEARAYERGAPAEAHLEEAEAHLEEAAAQAEARAYERGVPVEARLEDAETHLERSAAKVESRAEEQVKDKPKSG